MNRVNLLPVRPERASQHAHPAGGPKALPTYIVDLSKVDQGSFRSWPRNDMALSDVVLHAPLYMGGSTLGLGDLVWIDIIDSTGFRVITHNVEAIFHIMEHFNERDRNSFLAAAAVHYGFGDTWTLIKGRHE